MRGRWIALTAIIFGFMWLLWADYSVAIAAWFTGFTGEGITPAGAWGDTFGPFTAAISTIGTVLVLMTLAAQRKAVSDQAKDLHKQRFEGSFFELIKLLRDLRVDLRYRYSPDYNKARVEARARTSSSAKTLTPTMNRIIAANSKRTFIGKDAITAALVDARHFINLATIEDTTKYSVGIIYTKHIQPRAEPTFSPFFRIVYTILDRLRRDTILSENDKNDYARLLRSQLSSHELSLIAINACAVIAKDFDVLLTEFKMLKYHPPSKLDRRLRKAYPDEAFAPRPDPKPQMGIREYLYP